LELAILNLPTTTSVVVVVVVELHRQMETLLLLAVVIHLQTTSIQALQTAVKVAQVATAAVEQVDSHTPVQGLLLLHQTPAVVVEVVAGFTLTTPRTFLEKMELAVLQV